VGSGAGDVDAGRDHRVAGASAPLPRRRTPSRSVDRDTLRLSGPQINLSEAMARVPGLVVNNRNNYAQDLQISSRGFGARAGFGVRGMRLYADGIPASGPDGQGQVSHFDLAGAERVEVLRGPFSVLYGNSSGGVISLFSGARVSAARSTVKLRCRQLRPAPVARAAARALLDGGFTLRAASHLDIDGFRPHSAAQRDLANAAPGLAGRQRPRHRAAEPRGQPAQDPLGLTREQFDADPARPRSRPPSSTRARQLQPDAGRA
jgi:iron complex outermembrane receptor protein